MSKQQFMFETLSLSVVESSQVQVNTYMTIGDPSQLTGY